MAIVPGPLASDLVLPVRLLQRGIDLIHGRPERVAPQGRGAGTGKEEVSAVAGQELLADFWDLAADDATGGSLWCGEGREGRGEGGREGG